MQSSRQRYHIIVNALENVQALRDQLEQSSLVDIKSWANFPLLLNVSLTDVQAEWAMIHPFVRQIEPVSGIYLHEETTKQYEIQLATPADAEPVRLEILRNFDIEVIAYHRLASSLFVSLTDEQYRQLFALIPTTSAFAAITNIFENVKPIPDSSRVLNLQRYNWGVERITHRTNSFYETVRLTRTGKNVRVFVIDTGVQSNHDELRGRVSSAHRFDAFRDPSDPLYGEPSLEVKTEDYQVITDDHGTHVASLVAGSTVGVATEAEIISVRAFSNFEVSTTEHLLDAVDWVCTKHAVLGGPSIVNMSLAIDDRNMGSQTLGSMITGALIQAGLTVVVSAGNGDTDAYFESPANAGVKRELVETNGKFALVNQIDPLVKPITVGASVFPHSTAGVKDRIWNQSNWGDVVDLFAPGAEIYGASLQVDANSVQLSRTGSYTLKSGTSMAAPIVAGICALHLEDNASLTHADLREKLVNQATINPFDEAEVQHVRIDAPRFSTTGATVSIADLENKVVRSPNRLAYVWFTNTRIVWPEQPYEFSVDEGNQILFEINASSTDYYGDVERVDFSYTGIDVPSAYTGLGFATFYKTLQYVKNSGNITVNADVANFRINAPVIPADTAGMYAILADDGRVSSARRFVINTLNVPQAPVWISPPAGELTVTPAHKGDDYNVDRFVFKATQSDGLPVSYSFTPSRSLPPGLQFVNDTDNSRAYLRGRIGNIPYATEPKVYEFLVRATASNGKIAERLFTLTCEYVNELHFFTPSWLSSMYDYDLAYPGVKNFGAAGAGNSYFRHVEVTNKDADPLTYRIDYVPLVAEAPGIYNGSLPTGLGINSDGEIQGIIDPSVPLGLYFFRIIVEDLDHNQIFQDFVLTVNSSEDALSDSNQIIWITPAGNIGHIYETFASHLYVEARNPEGHPVRYTLSPMGGTLPDGMEVEPDTGLILGIAPFVTNNIDYTFVVRATVGARFVDREFSLRILSQYAGASVLNFKANMMGPDRLDIKDWTAANKILPLDQIFRPTDQYFGTPQVPFMYVLSGTSVIQPTEVMNYLKDYHKRMFLLFGKLDWAPAYDPSGFYAYDVIYMGVTDPHKKAGGFNSDLSEQDLRKHQDNPYDPTLWNEQSHLSRYYPNSIENVRDDLISTVNNRQGLALVGEEGLPLWMRSKKVKTRKEIVGFKPAIIVAYVKPGKGQELTNKLLQAGYNKEFVGREFILDRYFISNVVTKTTTLFDVVNGEPTTIFDDPTLPNYQGDDLSNLVQQTLFDVKTVETGKYYKFEDDAPILADRLQNPHR